MNDNKMIVVKVDDKTYWEIKQRAAGEAKTLRQLIIDLLSKYLDRKIEVE